MKLHESVAGRLRDFILAQPVFFVGTAPTAADGHINAPPKGLSMEYRGDRDLLTRWAERKSEARLREYRALKNSRSIDGLPAL